MAENPLGPRNESVTIIDLFAFSRDVFRALRGVTDGVVASSEELHMGDESGRREQ